MKSTLGEAIKHLVYYHLQARERVVTGMLPEDLKKKAHSEASSTGFLLMHMAETSLFFVQQLIDEKVGYIPRFGAKVSDTGQTVSLEEIDLLHKQIVDLLTTAITAYTDEDWLKIVPLKPFRPEGVSKLEGVQLVMMHAQHHLGQVSWCLKHPIS